MSTRLSLLTTCKPFVGHSIQVQRNALCSWAALEPRPEIIVVGDENGVAEICEELGFVHVPEVERSAHGVPTLPGLVAAGEQHATGEFICLINADIMLVNGLEEALDRVRGRLDPFLLISRRVNLDVPDAWNFERSGWQAELERVARADGRLEPRYGGVDLFAYARGAWDAEPLPAFAVGRGRWDSMIIYQARARKLRVIDATDCVFNVHQNHDYSHHPDNVEGVFKGPDALHNEALLGGEEYIFSALNATHELSRDGLRPMRVRNPAHLARLAGTLPATHPGLSFLSPVVRGLAPGWRAGRRAINRANRMRARVLERAARNAGPYPGLVRARPAHGAEVPPGGGVEDFDKEAARAINQARLDHVASLGLDIDGKTVLDVGSGPGHLAKYFADRGCKVTCLEGREENVARMAELYPELDGKVFDVESDDWSGLGQFDIVFCFGLLYHVENPWRVIQKLGSVSNDLLLLSTIVADHDKPLVLMEEETGAFTQALRNVGCRPTPSFISLAMRSAGFSHVYAPARPPDHPDFPTRWRRDLASTRDGHPIRAVFVASRRAIESDALVPLLHEA